MSVYILGKPRGKMKLEELRNLNNLDNINLAEKELDALYFYLDMSLDSMNEEEKLFWLELLQKLDKDFYED